MSNTEPTGKPPEPLSVQEVRKVMARVTDKIDRGDVDAITVICITPDNCYSIHSSGEKDRHEHAGLLLEAAMRRLHFANTDDGDTLD